MALSHWSPPPTTWFRRHMALWPPRPWADGAPFTLRPYGLKTCRVQTRVLAHLHPLELKGASPSLPPALQTLACGRVSVVCPPELHRPEMPSATTLMRDHSPDSRDPSGGHGPEGAQREASQRLRKASLSHHRPRPAVLPWPPAGTGDTLPGPLAQTRRFSPPLGSSPGSSASLPGFRLSVW